MKHKYQIGDLVRVKVPNHRFRAGDVGHVSDIVYNDGTEYWIRFPGFIADYSFSADSLEPAWIAERVKSAVRLDGNRVWIDTTFDDCRLQSLLVYSGDLETAKAIYQGRLRITAESTLTLVGNRQ